MLTCRDVANYFLIMVDRNAGDLITQLKLQKLVYLAQGICLSYFNRPLFSEKIEAWEHGPVVRSLRVEFGGYEKSPIPPPAEMDFDIYKEKEKALIYKTYDIYGGKTASELVNITHAHPVYIEAYSSEEKIINPKALKNHFDNVLKKEELLLTEKDKQKILDIEDEWWMEYDSGTPSEDITSELL